MFVREVTLKSRGKFETLQKNTLTKNADKKYDYKKYIYTNTLYKNTLQQIFSLNCTFLRIYLLAIFTNFFVPPYRLRDANTIGLADQYNRNYFYLLSTIESLS